MLLLIAIVGPVITIGMVAFAVLFFMRRTHHKRMMPSRTKHDPDTYYAGDELLRVTSAGDSTLRVSICASAEVRERVKQIFPFFRYIGIHAALDDVRLGWWSTLADTTNTIETGHFEGMYW